jgi:integrase
MSVRKRTWTTTTGEAREAWLVDYKDKNGRRHQEAFNKKRDADEFEAQVKVNVRQGIHTPRSTSKTVAKIGAMWIEDCALEGLERTTVKQYRSRVDLHLVPLLVRDFESGHARLGDMKLSDLTTPFVNEVRTALLKKLSRATAKKVLVSFRTMLAYAQTKGLVAQNVAAPVSIKMDARNQRKLEVGVDIPTREEISAMIAHSGALRPMLLTGAFTGLRVSELRGLRWSDVDFKHGRISVRQRTDRYNEVGATKNESSRRTLPVDPFVINTLKEWKLACPKGEADFVFPNKDGGAFPYQTARYHLDLAQVAAGLAPSVLQPKYGWHSLRHFYASLLINRKVDGGLEYPIKVVSEYLGHASIKMTADVYGHLFPSKDDGSALAAAVKAVLGLHAAG